MVINCSVQNCTKKNGNLIFEPIQINLNQVRLNWVKMRIQIIGIRVAEQ